MGFLKRLHQARLNHSPLSLVSFILTTPLRKFRHFLDNRAMEKVDTLQDRFTVIYARNSWGSKESVSGTGSTLAMTESIRSELPILLSKFDIKSIFDAPCGDFNWMRLIDLKGISYTGADIVKPLIDNLQQEFSSDVVKFVHLDITQNSFPRSDLVITRDCLFHLSYLDILATLDNFVISRSKFFLTTSYVNKGNFNNSDIRSGGFRLIDLFSSPFSFTKDFHFEISERGEGSLPPRKLFMWDLEQVMVAKDNLEHFISGL